MLFVFKIKFLKGMTVSFTRHFENIRTILSWYQKYMKNPNLEFEESLLLPFIQISQNTQENKYLNLLNSQQAQDIGFFFEIYLLKHIFKKLCKEFISKTH